MGVWGLCRKPKCPRPPVTHLPLFCSLGEAGGAGAEPPQNLPSAAAPVQIVFLYWMWYNFLTTHQKSEFIHGVYKEDWIYGYG